MSLKSSPQTAMELAGPVNPNRAHPPDEPAPLPEIAHPRGGGESGDEGTLAKRGRWS